MRAPAVLALGLALGTALLGAPRPAIAANCSFSLGFKTLHDLIPGTVGNCLVDEHHAGNGDSLQETAGPSGAGGLLVWRKADNWTAYTDGYHTWINGPYGLQERLNTDLFSWEKPAAAPVPTQPPPLDSAATSSCYQVAVQTAQALLPHLVSAAGQAELQQGMNDVRTGTPFNVDPNAFMVNLTPIQNQVNQDCQNILRYGTPQDAQCFGFAWTSTLNYLYGQGSGYFVVDPHPMYLNYFRGCAGHA